MASAFSSEICSTSTSPATKTVASECKICGAPTQKTHFGVLSCESCKIFFKRYALSKKVRSKNLF